LNHLIKWICDVILQISEGFFFFWFDVRGFFWHANKERQFMCTDRHNINLNVSCGNWGLIRVTRSRGKLKLWEVYVQICLVSSLCKQWISIFYPKIFLGVLLILTICASFDPLNFMTWLWLLFIYGLNNFFWIFFVLLNIFFFVLFHSKYVCFIFYP